MFYIAGGASAFHCDSASLESGRSPRQARLASRFCANRPKMVDRQDLFSWIYVPRTLRDLDLVLGWHIISLRVLGARS